MFFAPAGSFWTGKLMPNCFLPLNPANSSSFFTRQNVVIAIWNSFHRFGVINAFTNVAQKLGRKRTVVALSLRQTLVPI